MGTASSKPPVIRLLDMLAGWADFNFRAEDEMGKIAADEDVVELYQMAGALMDFEDSSREVQASVVEQFVKDSVLPLLLGRASKG